jgi:hypothetical protein
MSSSETGIEGPPDSIGAWTLWFAWFPVQLYMSRHTVWLRKIYRRNVRLHRVETCDYTYCPDEYPCPAREP